MTTELLALFASLTSIVGSGIAIASAYRNMDAKINVAVDARVGGRLAAVEGAARAAEDAAKMQLESKIIVVGVPCDSRDATKTLLRLSGWRGVDAMPFAEDPATLAALRIADAIVLDRADAATARAVAEFLGLPGDAADPYKAAYLPAVVWFTGADRVDTSPFGDGVVTANSRQTLRVHLANGIAARRWAQRARA